IPRTQTRATLPMTRQVTKPYSRVQFESASRAWKPFPTLRSPFAPCPLFARPWSWVRAGRVRDGPPLERAVAPLSSLDSGTRLDHHEHVPFFDGIAGSHLHGAHGSFRWRLDGHLHLHRLQDHDGLLGANHVAHLYLHLPHGPGDVRANVDG